MAIGADDVPQIGVSIQFHDITTCQFQGNSTIYQTNDGQKNPLNILC